jgi:hypothetical protein
MRIRVDRNTGRRRDEDVAAGVSTAQHGMAFLNLRDSRRPGAILTGSSDAAEIYRGLVGKYIGFTLCNLDNP